MRSLIFQKGLACTLLCFLVTLVSAQSSSVSINTKMMLKVDQTCMVMKGDDLDFGNFDPQPTTATTNVSINPGGDPKPPGIGTAAVMVENVSSFTVSLTSAMAWRQSDMTVTDDVGFTARWAQSSAQGSGYTLIMTGSHVQSVMAPAAPYTHYFRVGGQVSVDPDDTLGEYSGQIMLTLTCS